MDRNRETRRASMTATNGSSKRRQRSSSFRGSPEDDGAVEFPERSRFRDRGNTKKARDRDRDRDRDHGDRGGDRDRDRSSRNRRRRTDRLTHGSLREDGGDESTEESVNDDEDEGDDNAGGGGSLRMLPPNPVSSLSFMSNHLHRKSFPPVEVYKGPLSLRDADEMIGVSVPRKARSASTKRSNECCTIGSNGGSAGVGGEQLQRQGSSSPVRTSLVVASRSPASNSPPSCSNASARKKMPDGSKQLPPKTSSKFSSSNPDETEIEVAEVLFRLRRNPIPFKQEGSSHRQPSGIIPQNCSSLASSSTVAPKRKGPRPGRSEDDNPGSSLLNSPVSSIAGAEPPKTEISSLNLEKKSGPAVENGVSFGPTTTGSPELAKPETSSFSESRPSMEAAESKDAAVTEGEASFPGTGPSGFGLDDTFALKSTNVDSAVSESQSRGENKFQIDLMAPPPQVRSSPEESSKVDLISIDPVPAVSDVKIEKEEDKGVKLDGDGDQKTMTVEVGKAKSPKPIVSREGAAGLQLDLMKADRWGSSQNDTHQQAEEKPKTTRGSPNHEKTDQPFASLLSPNSLASRPGRISPMGYMGPLQGVVSMDGSVVPPLPVQPPYPTFSQPRSKRCDTHCHIAQNILHHQQMFRLWQATPGSRNDLKVKNIAIFSGQSAEDSVHEAPNHVDTVPRKQQILLQPALPPGVPGNILRSPAFILPAAVCVRPGSASSSGITSSAPATSGLAAPPMSLSYPNMSANEAQYMAMLQNNAYHVAASASFRGGTHPQIPFFSSPFYPQMLHPSLPQQPLQVHQNGSISTAGSSSSQKNLQTQQQQPQRTGHGSSVDGGGNLQSSKSRQMELQCHRAGLTQPACPNNNDMGDDGGPSTADSRNISDQSLHSTKFALMGHIRGDKRQQPETLPSHQAFGISFASINGAANASGLDMSSLAQNHAVLQSLPEEFRQSCQAMAAAVAAAQSTQPKNYQATDEARTSCAGDSSCKVEVKKDTIMKASAASTALRQSMAFPRPDSGSVPSVLSSSIIHPSTFQLQQQQNTQQQQRQTQMLLFQKQMQVQKQQSRTPVHEQLPSSMAAGNFPGAPSGFPQSLVQAPRAPPHWKNAPRPSTAPVASPFENSSTLKGQAQISFGSGMKSSTLPGSPTGSSVSQSGSPRKTTNSKTGPALSLQGSKNSVSGAAIIGSHHHVSTPSSNGMKTASVQQQMMVKQKAQQAPPYLQNSYLVSHASSVTCTASGSGGYHLQRQRVEQQVPPGSSAMTGDPAKAVGVGSNIKGSGLLPSQIFRSAQLAAAQSSRGVVPVSSFPISQAVHLKPGEPKEGDGE